MNNIFNFQRFTWLFKKHTKEHYKAYLMSLAVMAGILAIILCYIALMGGLKDGSQNAVFGSLLVGMGFIFTSSIFSDLGNKQKSISTLTLPVTHLERFLVAWIYSFIVFQIVYITCFYLINSLAINLNEFKTEEYKAVNFLWGKKSIYILVLLFYCFFHALAFVGAILFKKIHFVKTAFSFLVFFMIMMVFNKLLVGSIFDSNVISHGIPFTALSINEPDGNHYFLGTNDWDVLVLTIIALVSAVSMWTATYFKLKEKQV